MLGTPQDVAEVCGFFCSSDEARYVTGQVITITAAWGA
jgi:NAD(P)-dependent dehydrogenase (short-subunit alcohol dehydrogenase family)